MRRSTAPLRCRDTCWAAPSSAFLKRVELTYSVCRHFTQGYLDDLERNIVASLARAREQDANDLRKAQNKEEDAYLATQVDRVDDDEDVERRSSEPPTGDSDTPPAKGDETFLFGARRTVTLVRRLLACVLCLLAFVVALKVRARSPCRLGA